MRIVIVANFLDLIIFWQQRLLIQLNRVDYDDETAEAKRVGGWVEGGGGRSATWPLGKLQRLRVGWPWGEGG